MELNGGTIQGCSSKVNGGVIFSYSGSQIHIGGNMVIKDCRAKYYGGAVYISGATSLDIKDNAKIEDCRTETRGGAVFASSDASVAMSGGTVSGCYAEQGGGAFTVEYGTHFSLTGGTIDSCKTGADGVGGAFMIKSGKLEMTGSPMIAECSARQGGAIYFGSQDTTIDYRVSRECHISGGTIQANSANEGSAVYVGSVPNQRVTDTLLLSGGSILYNYTERTSSGAICAGSDSKVTIKVSGAPIIKS
ncbi:MAG: hypothetical protein IJV04_08245, partial [Lachnospiraceae bacterium]|nr:hypothetical protein [Lachnospiraceae bacterium]